jgi:hypothetical protein
LIAAVVEQEPNLAERQFFPLFWNKLRHELQAQNSMISSQQLRAA